MTAYKTCTEVVLLGREIGGYKGKDVQREAVDANERVPPFANSCQRDCGVVIKLGDLIQSDAVKVSSMYLYPETPKASTTYDERNAARFSSSFKAKTSCERDRPFPG